MARSPLLDVTPQPRTIYMTLQLKIYILVSLIKYMEVKGQGHHDLLPHHKSRTIKHFLVSHIEYTGSPWLTATPQIKNYMTM